MGRIRFVPDTPMSACVLAYAGQAASVLVNNVGLDVRTRIDTDGPPGNPAVVTRNESGIEPPLDRSVVGISGDMPGFYSGSAVAAIGNRVLGINGSLAHTTATDTFGRGVPPINVCMMLAGRTVPAVGAARRPGRRSACINSPSCRMP